MATSSSSTLNLPESNDGYGTKDYWEKRYTAEGQEHSFDWFLQPSYLLQYLTELLDEGQGKESRILTLGCGNSVLGEVLYDAGYQNVTNIDYSATLIDQMSTRYAPTHPNMSWLEMDIRALTFPDESFDVVIDKGTMDAMLTSKGDVWNPPEGDVRDCRKEVEEAIRWVGIEGWNGSLMMSEDRVLKKRPGSRFLYFTFGQPHFRKRYMLDQHPDFSLSWKDVGPPEGFSYFMYDLRYAPAAHS